MAGKQNGGRVFPIVNYERRKHKNIIEATTSNFNSKHHLAANLSMKTIYQRGDLIK